MLKDFLAQVARGCGERWQGVELHVITRAKLPLRKRIMLWISTLLADSDGKVNRVLTKQNKNLGVQNWSLIYSALRARKRLRPEGRKRSHY